MHVKPLAMAAAAAAVIPLALSGGEVSAHVRHRTLPTLRTHSVWRMPWQLSPASAVSRARGERTLLVRLHGYGRVRGTRIALRYLPAALPRVHGRNRLVKACRSTVAKAARKLGPVRVDAASAGPQRRTRFGYAAPVGFRLTYARYKGHEDYEVRQGVLTCTANRFGRITDAFV